MGFHALRRLPLFGWWCPCSEPPQGNGLDVVDDLVDEIEGELQTALLFVFVEQIVDVL